MSVERVDLGEIKKIQNEDAIENIAQEMANNYAWDSAIRENLKRQTPKERDMWDNYFKEHPKAPKFTAEEIEEIEKAFWENNDISEYCNQYEDGIEKN